MKRKIIIFLCCFLCILCGCSGQESGMKCKIGRHKLKITEIYFNNTRGLKCSEDNPYWEQILSDIELVSQKETREPTEFDFEPEITLIAANGVTCEMSFSVTAYSYPDVEGDEYENRDESAYYIRILRNGKSETSYYEVDEDVAKLRRNINGAVSYEYGRLEKLTGVIRYINNNAGEKKWCYVVSEYGDLKVKTEDFDGAIVGDTVEVELCHKADDTDRTADCEGIIHNLTNNDVTATSGAYLTALPFQYDIISYEGESDVFQINRLELETSREEFDFLLELWGDILPEEVKERLQSRYDDDFFAENILLYCGLDSPEAEVTAVVHTKWVGGENVVYVRTKEGQKAADGKAFLLCIEVPLEEWDEKTFGLYLFP